MAFKTFNTGDVLTAGDVNTYLAQQANIVCTSSTRPTSPVTGMEIYETDTRRNLRYDGSAWRIWPPVAVQVQETTNLTTTSGTYVFGTPGCNTTFTGPPSGAVVVTLTGHVEGYGTEGQMDLTYEIRETNSGGTLIVAASQDYGILCQGVQNIQASAVFLHAGLTPGQLYYIRTAHRSGAAGNSISVFHRRLLIVPEANA